MEAMKDITGVKKFKSVDEELINISAFKLDSMIGSILRLVSSMEESQLVAYVAYRYDVSEEAVKGICKDCNLVSEPVQDTTQEVQESEVEFTDEEQDNLTPCDCFNCPLGEKCEHYQAYRRHPLEEGGLSLCYILRGTIQEELKALQGTC